MLAAFAEAGRVLDRPDYTATAVANAEFLYATMRRDDGRLLRSWPVSYTHLEAAEDQPDEITEKAHVILVVEIPNLESRELYAGVVKTFHCPAVNCSFNQLMIRTDNSGVAANMLVPWPAFSYLSLIHI